MNLTTLHTIDTEYSADSIEWCPHPEYLKLFVCGTYQLDEDVGDSSSPPCRRKGRIYLYEFDKTTKSLKELQRMDTAAVLDMKWLPNSQGKPTLNVANALGEVVVYVLEENVLVERAKINLNPDFHNLLALSLDWDWQPSEQSTARCILASDSDGAVSHLGYNTDGSLTRLNTWTAHNFEAWICCFDKWDPNIVYTGGDDTFMHVYDVRTYERQLTNKTHIAGVTSMLSHPYREHVLLTGSYDERVRVYDTRSLKKHMTELNLHGGIWRLKADPLKRDLILTACMYKNFSILHMDSVNNLVLAGELKEHESICYGSDWCLDVSPDDQALYMATCSYYDNKLCLTEITAK